MINKALKEYINELLVEQLEASIVDKIAPVSGGSINQTFALQTKTKRFFLKVNHKSAFPQMFEKEEKALRTLKEKTALFVPTPFFVGAVQEEAFLLMEFVETAAPRKSFWSDFAEGLAQLHRHSSHTFGLTYNNYNGSLIQHNERKPKWSDFFIENRLMVQEKLAIDSGKMDLSISKLLNTFYTKIDQLFPEEAPALLHGDLWSGNFMVNAAGNPCIMDPAIYYGNREMDIAMSLLFGGFEKQFYETYHQFYPLQQGWESRIEICNLYPLLVHVNLFGTSYANRVKAILKRLVH